MSIEVKIPAAGESVSSGTLAQWHVVSGDQVEAGQTLFSLETDKITQDIEAEDAGIIELLVDEGEEVEVGAVVARIEAGAANEGDDAQAESESESASLSEPASEPEPVVESADAAGETVVDEHPDQSGEVGDGASAGAGERASSGDEQGSDGREFEVKVPPVGESVSSGTLSSWLVGDGEQVEVGQPLFSLETDKITQEIEAEQAGTLNHRVEEGSEVEIGQVVASIGAGAGSGQSAGSEQKGEPVDKPIEEGGTARNKAEPGSDPPERISKALAESSARLREQNEAKDKPKFDVVRDASPADQGVSEGRTSRQKMTQLRRKIARHLVKAQHEAAILTTFNEVDMSTVMRLRKELQEGFVARHEVKLGFMSFFVKAVVEALKAVPAVNARIDGEEIVTNHFYDIGCAIGTPKGLVVPVLRDCDQKDFATIEKDIIGYAERAKAGKLEMSDLQGGVFTISNGGVYGSLLSTPILNPPQSGILGMHTIQQRPVAVDGEVVIRPMMYLALSYDHRLVDGKEAVTFLIRIKECIEQPTRLLVGA